MNEASDLVGQLLMTGSKWDDVIIPGLDFVVIENTRGKFGKRVEDFNVVPRSAQPLVGSGV